MYIKDLYSSKESVIIFTSGEINFFILLLCVDNGSSFFMYTDRLFGYIPFYSCSIPFFTIYFILMWVW